VRGRLTLPWGIVSVHSIENRSSRIAKKIEDAPFAQTEAVKKPSEIISISS
jgi:hypothetical protein